MTRILIVDDEETIRLALRKFLRSRGYEVEIAGSGDLALQLLDKSSFSLMLCDVRMPGMTGVQIVPLARQTVQSNRAGYETSSTNFLALITSQRVLQDAESTALNHLADYQVSVAELDAIVGIEQPLPQQRVERRSQGK